MSVVRDQFYRGLFGLQFRTTVLLAGIVLAATGLIGATYLRLSTQLIVDHAETNARDLARALAVASAAAVEAEDHESLRQVAEESVKSGHLAYVIFADTTGRMLASFQRETGSIRDFLLDGADRVSVEPINRPSLVAGAHGHSRVDVVYPVQAISTHEPETSLRSTVGFIRLGVSLKDSEAQLNSLVRNVFGLTIGITLLMVPIGFQVVRHIAGPIEHLSRAARSFASGRLDARVEVKRRDEIGELARSFNAMADELASSHNQLVKLNSELEDRVLQRTNALENANRQLREMAARDSLTGLYNRRHFNDLLAQLFAESGRYGTDLTCMMMDLDNFKRVNDSLGHQAGDKLLQLTADVIRSSIREADVAVRYGGDEFAVLLPQTSPVDARNSAERIITNFRNALARDLPEANISTLSIGLVSRERNLPTTAPELVNLADEALYLAKAGGKNRITVARPAGALIYGATA